MIELKYDMEVYFPDRVYLCVEKDGKRYGLNGANQIRDMCSNAFYNKNYLWIGFNNRKYDHVLLKAIMNGATNAEIYKLSSSRFIDGEKDNWYAFNEYSAAPLADCYELLKKNELDKDSYVGLKEIGHRLRMPVLKTLPYDPNKSITDEQWREITEIYCHIDMDILNKLWEYVKPQYTLRNELSRIFSTNEVNVNVYGNLPKIAAMCIKSKMNGAPVFAADREKLIRPGFLAFESPVSELADKIFAMRYSDVVDYFGNNEVVLKYADLDDIVLGLGGVHAAKPGVYKDAWVIDVSSFYPRILGVCGIGSAQFQIVMNNLYEMRVELKRKKLPEANYYKEVLNSFTGYLKNEYIKNNPKQSSLYAPEIHVNMCIVGQFAMLDILKDLKQYGCLLLNTDGMFFEKEPPQEILDAFELRTGFKFEKKQLDVLLIRNVNSYLLVNKDGTRDGKKDFIPWGMSKTCRNKVCIDAVVENILHGRDIAEYILNCRDPFMFLNYRSKRKNKEDRDLEYDFYFGDSKNTESAVRFYVAIDGLILTKINKEKEMSVTTERVCICNDISDFRFENVDYGWYIRHASELRTKF